MPLRVQIVTAEREVFAAEAVDMVVAPGAEGVVGRSLQALLVEPRWGRRGHGSRLLAATIDTARGGGVTRAVTWIPEDDRAMGRWSHAAAPRRYLRRSAPVVASGA